MGQPLHLRPFVLGFNGNMRGSSLQTFALAVNDVAPRVSAATANSDFLACFS